jgi:hypothetical protein
MRRPSGLLAGRVVDIGNFPREPGSDKLRPKLLLVTYLEYWTNRVGSAGPAYRKDQLNSGRGAKDLYASLIEMS